MKERIDPMLDFRNFVYVVWNTLGLPEPTPIQYSMAEYIQHSPRRMILEAYRGAAKSYLSAAYTCWRLYLDPEIKILVVSAGSERANAFSIFVKRLLSEVPMLQHLVPDKSKGHRDSNIAFDVNGSTPSGSPSVKSLGITSQLTGSRANLIIADDVEAVANSATPDLRHKLQELVKEFAAVLSPDGKIMYLGTPQTEQSLYNNLETKGYQIRIYPARYPDAEQLKAYGSRLAPFIIDRLDSHAVGTPTDPLRFTHEDLLERELEYGKSGFALQFQLDTSLSDANKFPLSISDLIISPCLIDKAPQEIMWTNNPLLKLPKLPNVALAGQTFFSAEAIQSSYSPYDKSVMVIDPSGRGKDETGYAVAKMASGNIFVPDAGGLQGGYSDETLIALCNIAKLYKVHEIVVESNFGDSMYSALLEPHLNRIYPCKLGEVRQSAQKELRIINTLEPVLNQHRLVIDPKVIEKDYESAMSRYPADTAPKYMLFYQMARISKDRGSLKHDDRLDALAMAVQYFTDSLNVDAKANEARRKQEAFDEELEKWRLEASGGISVKQPLNFHTRLKDNILKPRN